MADLVPGTSDDWRVMALAAIGEGFCPEHGTPLDPQPDGGWCGLCGHGRGAWYSISGGETVVTRYPPLTWTCAPPEAVP